MRNYTLSKLILIPLLLSIAFLAHANNTYSSVYIFGDSLSDTGNLASIIGGFPAPYYMNRVSNGPVAVDTFTAKLGDTAEASLHLLGLNAGHNYSVAGAKASGDEVIDLYTQVLSFQVNHGYVAPEDALYVIFLGGNDVRDALHQPDPAVARSIIQAAITRTGDAINALSRIGAKSFLVINVPNIGLIPETQLMATATNNPTLLQRATELSKRYNKKLRKLVHKIEDKKRIRISEYNLFKLFNKIVAKAQKLGFSNNTDACFSSLTGTFHPDCNYGLNADQFVFFDEIHPTTRVHGIFGNSFYDKLTRAHHKDHDD